MDRIAILGTGLIGASVGLALREQKFPGTIFGWDKDPAQLGIALSRGAIDEATEDPVTAAVSSDVVLLAGPVFSILEWIDQLGPLLTSRQLITDVGSVKGAISERAARNFGGIGQAACLPGHPMAGKEVHGAEHAEASLFRDAVWLFTPLATASPATALETEWREWVTKFGCRTLDLDPARHDELCAWVSHLPQFVATAMSALLEDKFAGDADMRAIGGRALREMTRLGASPYSMWRDVAHTNTEAIAGSLLALEQRLMHLREHLKTPELRDEFDLANRFRAGRFRP
ncbi:Prephenate and/or arogenate dehydrogenase [Acidisarcina polymorpha]|uniref:Prephenate and/or arogenate dehydrogenase n=1 Tax=Acidisarcina polymorpha TaxID=2211140 RepID=A0A2Z5FWU5_9BACT|nr:prephenate dehydrogenase [Acidisarcina polymorpha]AXC11348.1 Prephenate and/or arogenate dehydrogenase [Acidisarcina polymorpha]